MTLLELQRRMLGDLLVPLDGNSVPDLHASVYITDSLRLSATERLNIYRRSYWSRAREAIAEDFPALRALVGTRRFADLVDAYLVAHPSRSWTLRNLSASLPEWLAKNLNHAGKRWRAARDAARLEWAYIESFDALSHPPLTPEAIATFREDAPLRLQPHLQLLSLDWNVDDLVIAVHRQAVGPRSTENPFSSPRTLLTIRARKRYLAVHRLDGLVYYRRLDKTTFQILHTLQQSHSLVQAVDSVLHSPVLNGSLERRIPCLRQTLAFAAQLGWIF